ncbi:MAG: hypothetical protein ONB44_19435 [candidate division KSB1 bacterium]|nr:hypothetical protein [candidate division KSB1 bacterium]MDZ7304303.1 hypothetical protein [candidate division KSB1 bacterium]MDZ7313580.1 hypothetical protein [candidate division KSB1 bacterium]
MSPLQSFWNRIPEQVKRLVALAVIMLAVLFTARHFLIPRDFGKYGHFRASAVDTLVAQPIRYAGQAACAECHDDVVTTKGAGYHRTVACEVCHGPAAAHTQDPTSIQLPAPRERGYCPLCHEFLPSRPTGFPQIVAASHNPFKPCITCHNPHDPKPPVTPKECEACHATIARTKSLSHHIYVPCTRCHETPEQHKVNPREFLAGKPKTRELCGGCHAQDADSPKEIPRIDIATHGERYVCWQCHYPHLPEAR